MRSGTSRTRGILATIGAVVLWSSSYVLTKIGVSDFPPISFAALRFVFAAAMLVIAALASGRLEAVERRDMPQLALGGLLGVTAYFAFQNLGQSRTSASEATLLVASFPVITMLLELVAFRRKPDALGLAGALAAILGVALVARVSFEEGLRPEALGDILLIGSGLAWGLYNLGTKSLSSRYSPFTIVFWQSLIGAAGLALLSLAEARAWRAPSLPVLLSALSLAALCSVGAFLLYARGLRSLEPGVAVGLMNLVPVFGLAGAVLALGERPDPSQLFGGALVLLGVMPGMRKAGSATPEKKRRSDSRGDLSGTVPDRIEG
jgi:drug/metabolite transporter (DMT)-like permease